MAAATARHRAKKTEWPHITLNKDGAPCIDGTRFKVATVVIDYTRNRLSVEQIQQTYPNISLAQVHAALLYYYDHKSAIDDKIEADDRFIDEMRASQLSPVSRQELVKRRADKHARTGSISMDAA